MLLQEMFVKPVDRHIDGVIKADDEASLLLEVEEYVLTNEVGKRLEAFVDAYNNYDGSNGVWISGFFGSGKSHLLKMLALLLENRTIDGTSVLDLFLAKCGDEILRSDLKKAVAIPTKSILFNIDQKADVISKTQTDALLSVFVKVFDDMCGYYGKHGHIAQFERNLEGRGLYAKFKEAFQAAAGQPWEVGREEAILESGNIDKAYAKITGAANDSTTGIIDKYRSEYKLSIEDFADHINDYINKQPPNFRLNFFVDEVGQYIANNTKLMTNLQTVAESLATKCRGRAWIIVTAQADMDAVVGEMTNRESNDFSKIQARFAIRLKLTSANVDEVIQKRLLLKNEAAVSSLSDVYHAQANNLKTMFDFADGAQAYRNFQDRDHFIRCYPFIPYQFDLFQTAIQSLSQHGAFEGKHSSVGERSMLGVFQQVVNHISKDEVKQLATFDLMFEGIRSALKANLHAIHMAEKNLENPFAVKVLKALFLVKYVKSFKATVRNLCVLMLDDLEHNITSLRQEVQGALNLLEQQTYIQRNGEIYEFLTSTEKDVEKEIKNTDVEAIEVADELAKLVFDYVLPTRKIRYDGNGQDYSFTRKLDDRLVGREHELTIHVITPFHDAGGDHTTLGMRSMGRDELLAIMPTDERLVRDLLMYKRTKTYCGQNISRTQQESVRQVLTNKALQNQDRYRDLQALVKKLLGEAKFILNMKDLEIGGTDASSKLTKGFYELLQRSYPNLNMLRDITYSEKDTAKYLKQAPSLLGDDDRVLGEAEQELLAFIQGNKRTGIQTTLKSLVERFEKKPYGWYLAAILCNLAKLCGREKLEVRHNSNQLEGDELVRTLLNTQAHGSIYLEPQVDFTASQVRHLKELFEDLFDSPPRANEAKALGQETGVALQELLHELTPYAAQAGQYPFLAAINPAIDHLKATIGKPYAWYLTELPRQEEALLDLKEQVITPVRNFMVGPQKGIFEEARKFVQVHSSNFSYLDGDEGKQIVEALADPECYKGNRIQRVKELLGTLQGILSSRVAAEKQEALALIKSLEERMVGMAEFQSLAADRQAKARQPFTELVGELEKQEIIGVIRDRRRQFEEEKYPRLLEQLTRQEPKPEPKNPAGGGGGGDVKAAEPKVEFVYGRKLSVKFTKPYLANKEDVDAYLAAVREAYLKEIEEGKRIQI